MSDFSNNFFDDPM